MIPSHWQDVKYNGDTLYYTRTRTAINKHLISSGYGMVGSPGESGSPFIYVNKDSGVIYALGALSWAASYGHYRIKDADIRWASQIINKFATIAEGREALGLEIFPNPAHGYCRISGRYSENGQPGSFRVIDMNGREVASINSDGFDSSALANGVYILQPVTGRGTVFTVAN
jgi:hypothetical protein